MSRVFITTNNKYIFYTRHKLVFRFSNCLFVCVFCSGKLDGVAPMLANLSQRNFHFGCPYKKLKFDQLISSYLKGFFSSSILHLGDTESLNVCGKGVTFQVSHVMCHMLHVTCHMSIAATATATDPPPANSPTLHSRAGWFAKTQQST